MVLKMTNGTDTHRHRVHLLPFNKNAFIVGGGTPSVSSDDGNHDYAYTPDRPAGQEAGITDTFAAYCGKIKGFWPSTWTISLDALFQRQNDGTLVEVFPVPNATPVQGNSPNAGPTGIQRCVETIANLKTNAGNRGRLIFMGNTAYGVTVPATVTGNASSSDPLIAAIGYVASGATAIVGHDGQKFSNVAHVTYTYNRRLRRHYGYA
jgi:hypothetical protein